MNNMQLEISREQRNARFWADELKNTDKTMTIINGWKLFNLRKDGTIGPLFINRRQRIPSNQWLDAESHPTKGFAPRPQWHATSEKSAPHLSPKGRVWRRVQLQGVTPMNRPASQGGTWFLANKMLVLPA